MSKWFPLHLHGHYSLLDGLSKPEQIAKRLVECGYAGAALTDHATLAGVPSFLKAIKKVNLKAIAGCEFNVTRTDSTDKTAENASYAHVCVLAKGQQGWKNLIKASSESNRPEHFYRKPRLDLERLGKHASGEWIVFSGHVGSDLANILFVNRKAAYAASSYDEAKSFVRTDWKEALFKEAERYREAFGKENFYLEIQLIDQDNLPASLLIAKTLRWLGGKMGIPCVATADSHYPTKEDAADQRILLCSALKTSLKKVQRQIEEEEEVGLGGFFKSNRYHIPSYEEMSAIHSEEELKNSLEIASRCETPNIFGKPLLPVFQCPNNKKPDDYLQELCGDGWNRKVKPKVRPERLPEYAARIKKELGILQEAGLSSYFLIVEDFIRFALKSKCRIGAGRGSAAGCLVSYLLDITNVDPIKHDLLFERFYTDSRNVPSCVSFDECPFGSK